MIYELSYDGYSLGMFPTRTEAMRRASFLPKSRYIVREWEDDAPFLFFDAERHLLEEFDNAENDASPSISAETIERLARRIDEQVADAGSVGGFECVDSGFIVFVEVEPVAMTRRGIRPAARLRILSVWDACGRECRSLFEALQVMVG